MVQGEGAIAELAAVPKPVTCIALAHSHRLLIAYWPGHSPDGTSKAGSTRTPFPDHAIYAVLAT